MSQSRYFISSSNVIWLVITVKSCRLQASTTQFRLTTPFISYGSRSLYREMVGFTSETVCFLSSGCKWLLSSRKTPPNSFTSRVGCSQDGYGTNGDGQLTGSAIRANDLRQRVRCTGCECSYRLNFFTMEKTFLQMFRLPLDWPLIHL